VMAPWPADQSARAAGCQVLQEAVGFGEILRRHQIADRQRDELLARVAIVGDRRVTDGDDRERLAVIHHHRLRVVLQSIGREGREDSKASGGVGMLWTIFVILLVLWLLGLVSSYTLGGYIHILLLIALVVLILQLVSGRRPIV